MRRALVGVLVLACVLALAPPGAAQDKTAARKRANELHAKLQRATEELVKVEVELGNASDALAQARAAQQLAKKRLDEARRRISAQAGSLYRSGGISLVSAVLENDAEPAIDRVELVTVMMSRQSELIAEARAASAAYEETIKQVREAARRESIAFQKQQRLVQQIERQYDEARRYADWLEGFAPTTMWNGRLVACPLSMPYTYTDTWGAARSGGRSHEGTDIMAPLGTNVHAYTNGVITRWSDNSLGGITLYMMGDDGNEYYYAHLLSRIAPPGKRVKAGELIAKNGKTGNARYTAPHVHFEVHPGGGAPVNPYPYVKAACRFLWR